MNDAGTDAALAQWTSTRCPFPIEYLPRVLDDIRLAVVDAFFSLPRGGAEIGGILMGQWTGRRLAITGYCALDCEHANGPSFTLSANDEARLRDLIVDSPAHFPGLLPVGWYHSHTRSEIFLSDTDLEIHRRFFPEPWQIALVLKPHTFQPTRAGFFFRETNGEIHCTHPYEEFTIEAQPMRPVPMGPPLEMPKPGAGTVTLRRERNPEIGVPAATSLPVPSTIYTSDPEPAVNEAEIPVLTQEAGELPQTAEPETLPHPPPPAFLTQTKPSRRWGVAVLAVAAGLAVGVAAYVTHPVWLPKLLASVRPASATAPVPPSLGLKAIDQDGQLQINWNRNADSVRGAVDATIEITDGSPVPQAISLDQAHLQNGAFTYGRQSDRVDVKLILHQPDGQQVREVTTFLGKLPVRKPAEEDPEIRRQRDELAEKANKLKSDLEKEAARTRKLERDLRGVKDEVRQQQQRRMANQLPDVKQ